jgi:prepilin-type N-terminal cleavage/methylation domain-containing protein
MEYGKHLRRNEMYLMKQKGVTLVEVMVALAVGATVVVGGATAFNNYNERKLVEDKISTTSQQIARFSDATYEYVTTAEGVEINNTIITVEDLVANNILPSGFTSETPFGQNIKAFIEKDPSSDDYHIIVSTTGNINDETTVEPSIIYRDSYSRLLRQDVGIPSDRFSYGKILNNEFRSVMMNKQIVADRNFMIPQGEEVPAVLIISEDLSPELEKEVRVLAASPELQNPASGTHYSTLTASIRDEDGDPIANEQIFWNTSMGNLRDVDTITDADGVSENRIYSNDIGNARVEARIAGDSKTIDVEFSPPFIELSTTGATVNANDSTCFDVTAEVKYPAGQIADFEPLNWDITSSKGDLASYDSDSDEYGIAEACVTSDEGGTVTLKASLDKYPSVEDVITLDFDAPIIYDIQVNETDVKNDGKDFYEIVPFIAFPDGEPLSNADIEWRTTSGFFDEDTNKKRDFTSSDSSGYSYNKFYSEVSGSNTLTISIESDSRDINIGFIGPKILDLYYEYGVNDELVRYSEQIAQCIGDGSNDDKITISKTADIFALIGYQDGTLVGEDYPIQWKAVVDGSTDNSVTRTNSESVATVSFTQDGDATKTYSISASIPGSPEEGNIDVSLGENGARVLLLETGAINNISLTKGDSMAYVKSCFDNHCKINNGKKHYIEVDKVYQYSAQGSTHQFHFCKGKTNSDCASGPSSKLAANSPKIKTIAESVSFPSNGKPYWTNIGSNKEILLINGECTNPNWTGNGNSGGGNGNSGGGNGNSGGGNGNSGG